MTIKNVSIVDKVLKVLKSQDRIYKAEYLKSNKGYMQFLLYTDANDTGMFLVEDLEDALFDIGISTVTVNKKSDGIFILECKESIIVDPDVLAVLNEVKDGTSFFSDFVVLEPGMWLVRRQSYTRSYDPNDSFSYFVYTKKPKIPKAGYESREGYFNIQEMEEPVVAYIKGRFDNPLQVVNCTKVCSYYESIGDEDDGYTWYKEFYFEILRVDSVESINIETANHSPEDAMKMLGLDSKLYIG